MKAAFEVLSKLKKIDLKLNLLLDDNKFALDWRLSNFNWICEVDLFLFIKKGDQGFEQHPLQLHFA